MDLENTTRSTTRRACIACGEEFDGNSTVCPKDGTILTPLTQENMVGRVIGDNRYEILEVIGGGGMGLIYKAQHLLMKRMVAIKMMHPQYVSNSANLLRFQQEARAASALSHQNILTVFDFGLTPEGSPYLVMDYLEGTNLAEVLDDIGYLSAARAAHIFSQTASGLAHAHSKGVIHRDLKPGNIMLVELDGDPDFVKIVDFGIAKIMPMGGSEGANLTKTGEVFGSPLYMSPEQCRGVGLDARSDIYSVGCVMYRALSGGSPFVGEDPLQCMYKHVNEMPPPIFDLNPESEVPSQLEAIVLKCLAKDPDGRFQNMVELKEAIDLFISGGSSDELFSTGSHNKDAAATSVTIPLAKAGKEDITSPLPTGAAGTPGSITAKTPMGGASAAAANIAAGSAAAVNIAAESTAAANIAAESTAANIAAGSAAAAPSTVQVNVVSDAVPRLVAPNSVTGGQGTATESSLSGTSPALPAASSAGYGGQSPSLDATANITNHATSPKILGFGIPQLALGAVGIVLIVLLGFNLVKQNHTGHNNTPESTTSNLSKGEHSTDSYLDDAQKNIDAAKYTQAEQDLNELFKNKPTMADDRRATALNLRADARRSQFKFAEAIEDYKAVLALEKQISPYSAHALNGLGEVYAKQSKFDEAKKVLDKAHEMDKNFSGDEHIEVARTSFGLGNLALAQGNYSAAARHLLEAGTIIGAAKGENSLEIARVYNALAQVYQYQKKYKDALKYYDKAEKIRRSVDSYQSTELADTLQCQGTLYFTMRKYGFAADKLKQSLALYEKVLKGDNNLMVATNCFCLGVLYEQQGRLADAAPYYNRAYLSQKAVLGASDPKTLKTASYYASILKKMGKPAEAAKVLSGG